MSINLKLPNLTELKPRITVIGVGGAGGNAVNNMIASGLSGVDFVVANTDAQAIAMTSAEHTIQLGVNLTEGLGAGSKPEIGEAAAEEAIDEIKAQITGSHMVFVAAGMGGGTGTGAAPVMARASKELGILTVGVVTKPFQFEGNRRMRMAEAGITELRKYVDTLIVIPNQNLFRIANEKTTFAQAFLLADQVLHSGVACITDLIVREGLINLDFADVRAIMADMGSAMMGMGEASGERRAIEAAELAILNPLLDDISMKGARGLLVSISGNHEMTLYEVHEAASRVREEVDAEANIIVGATFDETLNERIRVSIVASGLAEADNARLSGLTSSAPDQPRQRQSGPASHSGQASATAGNGGGMRSGPANRMDGRHGGHQDVPADDVRRRLTEALNGGSSSGGSSQPGGDAGRGAGHGAGHSHGGHADRSGGSADDGSRRPQHRGDERSGPHAGSGSRPSGATTWEGPGDVTIELGLPQLTPAAQGPRPSSHSEPSQRPANAPFEPGAPAIARKAPRRMPDVEDFPMIGQKDYAAKKDGSKAAAPEETRRGGLFGLLTGRSRSQSDSAANAPSGSATRQQPHDNRSDDGHTKPLPPGDGRLSRNGR